MSFIKPAGDFKADPIQAQAEKERGIAWCRVCGRKHPRKGQCDMVEYEQGGEFEKMMPDDTMKGEHLQTLRHPGRWIHKTLYEKGIHNGSNRG